MDPIFEFIGKVVAIGGSSAIIAYGIFTLVGRKWLETKFAERLEAYKHEQTRARGQVLSFAYSLKKRVAFELVRGF